LTIESNREDLVMTVGEDYLALVNTAVSRNLLFRLPRNSGACVCAANNKTTTSTYDYLWRINQVTNPDGGTTNYTYVTGCQPYVSILEAVTSTTSRTRTAKLDNMGRLQEKDANDPIGGTICQTKQYNSMSQVSSSSLPFRDGQPVYSNTYQYSASRRSSTTLAGGGTILYSYDFNTTTVTNTDGKKRKYSYQEDGSG
jgi:hypothetical protein